GFSFKLHNAQKHSALAVLSKGGEFVLGSNFSRLLLFPRNGRVVNMNITPTNLIDVALQHHDAMPKRIRQYLNGRGIPDHIINSHHLGWNGWRITIPIYNREDDVVFFKLSKDPHDRRPAPQTH